MTHLFSLSKKNIISLFLITLLIGLLVRVYVLDSVSLYGDELTIVYDTYSVLKTGHDQLGNFLPITFPMGAGRPGGYIYGSLPFVAIFGPDTFGTRGLSILSGLGIILASYFLVKGLSLSKNIAIIVSIMLIFAPWAVNLSRGGFESHFGLFLTITGLTSLLYVKQRPWLLFITAFTIGLAIHTYPTFKLTLPLMLLLFGWFVGAKSWFINVNSRKYLIISILILAFFAGVSLLQTIGEGSDKRFLSINIFSNETITQKITENVVLERNLNEISGPLDNLFHNRYVAYPLLLLNNYFESLSVKYLFLSGDFNPRHNMTQSGAFYVVEIITMFIGFISLLYKQKRTLYLLIGWIFIAPVSTALLTEVHTLRNSLLFLPLSILSGVGFYTLFSIKQKKTMFISFTIISILLLQMAYVFEKLYFVSPNLFSRHWAYPAKQLSMQIEIDKKNYDYVIVRDNIDNIEYAYPTYAKIDPNIVVNAEKNRITLNNKQFKQFGNVYIGGVPDTEAEEFLNALPGRVLYFANSEQMESLQNYSVVTGKDNLVSYIVKEIIR